MGMMLFCQSCDNGMRFVGWESSITTWSAFMRDLRDCMNSGSPLRYLDYLGSDHSLVSADLVKSIRDELIKIKPVLGYMDNEYKGVWLDRLIKCCNVAIANQIGLESWW